MQNTLYCCYQNVIFHSIKTGILHVQHVQLDQLNKMSAPSVDKGRATN